MPPAFQRPKGPERRVEKDGGWRPALAPPLTGKDEAESAEGGIDPLARNVCRCQRSLQDLAFRLAV